VEIKDQYAKARTSQNIRCSKANLMLSLHLNGGEIMQRFMNMLRNLQFRNLKFRGHQQRFGRRGAIMSLIALAAGAAAYGVNRRRRIAAPEGFMRKIIK
jgi:hypothetical protein